MILINLLPHREIARKKRRDAFNVGLASSALIGGIIAGVIFLWFQAHISTQQSRNRVLQSEIDKFNEQIKDIAGLESQIAALVARQQAVEDLQSDRNLPVHLLNELVRLLPEGVYVQSLRQEAQNVLLQGVAQSNERVSELLRNFSNQSRWFAKPDLVEIITGTVALSPRDTRRVANFSMRVKLVRASEQNKEATAQDSAASAPKK
ncbi:PilN domain-containing protein [Candidatus Symbiobacter mobilis]|uniref:Type IV pilus assembly protein PilN n=1 Tax=Candidatus Symbiobacter mobilis CR TaxID=946483 RepID=U5N7Q3_9BURK|nr:PilN domain-containing protein [Candidatus Symbiobacter mobilis]AGX87571.1 type IV pilus assembly protein PilN [Candidatus Symbiobacter mobilis CR]